MSQNIHVLARAVIIDQGHILLCQALSHDIKFYFLPGGHIEHGENAQETIQRELQEEATASGQVSRFLGCLEYQFKPSDYRNGCHDHEYNLIFEVTSSQLKVDLPIFCPEQHIKLEWVPLNKISEIDLRPFPLKSLIQTWLNSDHKLAFYSLKDK